MSVEADVKGNEKQEFLFTLYDLDGYGKITKDVSLKLNSVLDTGCQEGLPVRHMSLS